MPTVIQRIPPKADDEQSRSTLQHSFLSPLRERIKMRGAILRAFSYSAISIFPTGFALFKME